MFRKSIFILSSILLLQSLTACFSVKRQGGVLGVHGQKIQSTSGTFEVGDLPSGWSKPQQKLKQLLYTQDAYKATIVTDALCGKKFEDSPLRRLAQDLFEPMEKSKINTERNFVLDGRAAYEIAGEGLVDGVAMAMDVIVVKKDFCLYDFVVFAPQHSFQKAQKDFKNYVSGFRTR